MARTFAYLVVALVACLTFGLPTASAAPRCQASDLRASTVGEAGRDHIIIRDPAPGDSNSISNLIGQNKTNRFAVVQLRNVSGRTCSVSGYPRLALLRDGNSLPSRTVRVGGTYDPSGLSKHIANLTPGQSAAVLVGYSTRTTQPGTRCRSSTNLLVALPGMGHHNVTSKIKACNDGMLYTSPVLGFANSGDGNFGSTLWFANLLGPTSGLGAENGIIMINGFDIASLGSGNTGNNNLGNVGMNAIIIPHRGVASETATGALP